MELSWKTDIEGLDWNRLHEFYARVPLGSKSVDQLRTAFQGSRYTVFLFDGETLVGAGRALADGSDCSYLCDIALLPEYQGRGLGAALVGRLVELSRGHRKILLYAVPGKEGFYRRFGFRRMTTAMAIFADEPKARAQGFIEED